MQRPGAYRKYYIPERALAWYVSNSEARDSKFEKQIRLDNAKAPELYSEDNIEPLKVLSIGTVTTTHLKDHFGLT